MAKSKKKVSEQARINLERAKHRKLFLGNMAIVCDEMGGKGTFELIPRDILEIVYNTRCNYIKVNQGKGLKVPEKVLKLVHNDFVFLGKRIKIQASPDNPEYTLFDFMTVFLTINIVLGIQKDKPWSVEFDRRLQKYEPQDIITDIINKIFHMLEHLSIFYSEYRKRFVWFDGDFRIPENRNALGYVANVNIVVHEEMTIKTSEGKRQVWRVSWVNDEGLKNASIKPALLGIKTPFAEIPVGVYVQDHALTRLYERIDGLDHKIIQAALFHSIDAPVITHTDTHKILVEYRICNSKLGYLVCEYAGGIVLIRTFLFITNNGTPEGRKLNELTDLGKLDKKYLAIDKLSCFIGSDIATNKILRPLFEQAGCSCLFHLNQVLLDAITIQNHNPISELITSYLDKENKGARIFENAELKVKDAELCEA